MLTHRLARLVSIIVMLAGPAGGAVNLYVAPEGRDSNPGTERSPFATLERARDHLRQLASRGQTLDGATVWLSGGNYFRTNAFELSAADSGTPKSPVAWRAQRGATVRLLGGRFLQPGKAVRDSAVRGRLGAAAREKVVEIELRGLGAGIAEMHSRGFGRPTRPSHAELFFESKPMTLARWPDDGTFELIAGFPEGSGQDDSHSGKIGKLEGGFFYQGDRPNAWAASSNIWVHGYWSWDWANSYERIATFDKDRRLITSAAPHGLYGFRKGQRFYFLNVLEELDQPSEYFVDAQRSALYFWPPASAVPSQAAGAAAPKAGELLLSVMSEPLVKLTGVSNVLFRDLVLEATRGNAVEIRGGASNLIGSCVIRNVGNNGVLVEGGTGHRVTGCDILDTGDGGVSMSGGDRKTLEAGGHVTENCYFARQGRWSKCYVPGVLMNGVGLRASNNYIHEHPHCAILFNGNDHRIEFNEITRIALETGDVGAIYTGRDYTYRGNRICHNYIHHTGGVGMGSMGIYMDDCVSGADIYANIFYRVQRAAFLGGGRDHRVVNNIFIECDHAVELDGRGLDRSPVWWNMVDKTMRDRLSEVPIELYRIKYPELRSLDAHYGPPGGTAIVGEAFKGVPPANNVVARNICVGKWLKVYWHAGSDMLRLENNLTNEPPKFVEAPGDAAGASSFALQPDSPAWKLGFERIPVERIGLRLDEFRRRIPELDHH